MKRSFFERYALLILMLTFFLVPFAFRGARMAVRGMRNDVRDWLPESFAETKELEWFRANFASESFVVVSWEGCHGTADDDYFRLFLDKFYREVPPSQRVSSVKPHRAEDFILEDVGLYGRDFRIDPAERKDFIGNKLGLYATGDEFAKYANSGGLREKWLRGEGRSWYYLLPNGNLYRWEGHDTLLDRVMRTVQGWMEGRSNLEGTLVAALGQEDGSWYYQDPRRLEADLFERVVTGPSLLTDLLREGGALEGDPKQALDRFRGLLFGPDGKQTCLMISLTEHGARNLHRIAGRGLLARPRGKLLAMAEDAGLQAPPSPILTPPPFDRLFQTEKLSGAPLLHIGGGVVDNVAIDEEGQATLVRLVGLSVLLGLGISWFSFRSIGVTLLLFLVGGTAAVGSLALVWWSGGSMDAVLMSMPSLVYVLGLSGAVHIVNYYRDTVDRGGFPGNPGEAVNLGWKPCVLASFTTALGLASLATSNIVPIRKFGFFSAIAVVAALSLVFFFLPAGLQYWPPKSFHREEGEEKAAVSDVLSSFWRGIGLFIIRRQGLVSVACAGILVFSIVGLFQLNTSVQIMNLFHPDAKIIKDYEWLETNLGKLVPMELVVRVDPAMISVADLADDRDVGLNADARRANYQQQEINGQSDDVLLASATEPLESQAENGPAKPALPMTRVEDADEKFRLSFLDRVQLVDNVRKAIHLRFGATNDQEPIVGQAMSASTFVPPLPKTGGGTFIASVRGGFSRRLATYRHDIATSGYYSLEADRSELWRLSLRVPALETPDGVKPPDYGEFVGDLKSTVEPVMAAYRARETVLRTIDRRNNGEGFRGAKVLVLGVPFGDSKLAGERDPKAESQIQGGTTATEQWQLFSLTLQPLLRNAALAASYWHDPRFTISDELVESMPSYDCIVVVRPDDRYDKLLQQVELSKPVDDSEPPAIVRASDYEFDGASELSVTSRMNGDTISTTYTGLVPVVYKAQRTLLRSLVKSTGWAFVAISIVMIFLLRSPSAGMVSMVPNVFPVVVVFGLMGWSDVIVDIGTMMTASVAMGVAVDDTIHFLTWFRRGLDDGLDRHRAIMLAYDRCATAMTQTTMIAGLGLAIFALSTFTPTERFGILMLTLMFAALLGDLIFLPAILAGPFGKVFSRKNNSPQVTQAAHATIAVKPASGSFGNSGGKPAATSRSGRSSRRRDSAH